MELSGGEICTSTGAYQSVYIWGGGGHDCLEVQRGGGGRCCHCGPRADQELQEQDQVTAC